MHDVVIVGAGPAGMTAAIYAARKVLDLVMISPDVGGQTTWAGEVQNYLGYEFISGFDLVMKFEDHVRNFGVNRVDDRVTRIEKKGHTFLVNTESGKEFEGRTVIVSSGRSSRNLGVPGEEDFKGKGVSYCATCDAPLFAGETVAVVGGGNAGLDAALQLTKIADQVHLLEVEPELNGDASMQQRVMSSGNVDIRTHTEVVSVRGNQLVEGITVRDTKTGAEQELPVAGVFVEIGSLPNVGFLPDSVYLDHRREIVIDCANRTNIPGLFAAGDVTSIPGKQIITAAGEGAKALLSAYDYLVRTFPDHI